MAQPNLRLMTGSLPGVSYNCKLVNEAARFFNGASVLALAG